MTADALDLWLYDTRAARLTRTRRDLPQLEWTTEAIDRWGEGSRVVSNLLPVGAHAYPGAVKAFLDGYLPEGQSRTHHAVEAGVDSDDTFGLIATYGRDIAGAIIVVGEDASPTPAHAQYVPLDQTYVAERLSKASRHTGRLDARDSFSSLPGMVPKILLHRDEQGWLACRGGAPSTWIIKRSHDADGPAADVIDTEVLALACAARIGLGNITAEILHLGDMRAIAVPRYDRRVLADGTIGRVHQEDLAQAIGLNTGDANRKLQRGAATMPSLGHAARVLEASGSTTDPLLALVTFNFALGNTDMHAKNLSFLRSPTGRVILAPAYDVSMHLHAPDHNGQVAMQINGKNYFDDIGVSDLQAESRSWGLPVPRATATIVETLASLGAALLAERETGSHPGVTEHAWDHVQARVEALVRDASDRS
ncbi:HipA domain-containing protein [Nocardioides plantarum]|uniref:HipA domain-containing protein n=1 Tax=Nocardioides plantarum TaxID=29299 RepID=A0ABV5KFM6_9ACTN|nr:HipA domain-containing protein [Nocardioides plantarum]